MYPLICKMHYWKLKKNLKSKIKMTGNAKQMKWTIQGKKERETNKSMTQSQYTLLYSLYSLYSIGYYYNNVYWICVKCLCVDDCEKVGLWSSVFCFRF